jgi:serine/threonine protein kinase
MSDMLGKTLGQYELLSIIGTGGMAVVYKARQESMDRDVAIKVIGGQLAENADFITRFEREARLIAKLQHPHILPVYDFGRDSGRLYMVMRLVDGGSLDEKLRNGPMQLAQVARMISGIASAMAYAHDQGIVHRDLKPNNILLDSKDNPYLTDFGIAKALQDSENRLTATGTVMGTPSYMAPEQWRGEPVDARTDIYALGVMLFEMLTGKLPFTGDTPYALMYKHFDAPPPSPLMSNPNLPEGVTEVLNRALAKVKTDRYASADALAEDFNLAIAGQPLKPLTTQPSPDEATFIGGIDVPMGAAGDLRTTIGAEIGTASSGRSTNQNVGGRTAAGQTSAGQTAPASTMAQPSRGVSPILIGLAVVILLLLVGGGAFFVSQSVTNGNLTATQNVLAGQTATKLVESASTGTALALIPTNTTTPPLKRPFRQLRLQPLRCPQRCALIHTATLA